MSYEQKNKFSTEYCGRTLTIETGSLAFQAHGSCTVRYGDTVVLATAVRAPEPREGVDFFPLLVDYEERLYAAGIIKGSQWIKREGRPSDESIITTRVIDRSIRPLFKDTARNDVQVVVTVLSYDGENDPDIPAIIAASTALAISPIPWNGPLAGIRVGRINGEWVLNTTYEARKKSEMDLILAGTADHVVMLDCEGSEVADDVVHDAIGFGLKHLRPALDLINQVVAAVGQPKIAEPALTEGEQAMHSKVAAKVDAAIGGDLQTIFGHTTKTAYRAAVRALEEKVEHALKEDSEVSKEARAFGMKLFEERLDHAARHAVLETGTRVDGRAVDEIRPLSASVGILPRTHGSGLFQRGETQVLSTVTLGAPGDQQSLEELDGKGKKRYMHHYNFPGFSVGEVKPQRSTGRREIGHGALAEKALEPVLPDEKEFPYTIRVVSEVLASNGSSSQASACGSTLALMDAGVPLKRPVAGIAMGLLADLNDPTKYRVITDIQGIEDHSGDMDFKVAGTTQGITAIQLDIKLGGITMDVVKQTLEGARQARLKILDVMAQAIAAPRAEMSPYAPRIEVLHIDPEMIRVLIGPGGKTINQIIDETGVNIDVEKDGTVFITSANADGMAKAKEWVEQLTKEVKVGEDYEGTVTQIIKGRMNGDEIGAIVEFLPGKDGMVHISEIANYRIGKVSDVWKIGDRVKVRVKDVDREAGKISLSHRPFSEDITVPEAPMPHRGDGGRGGFDRGPRRRDDRGPRHGGGGYAPRHDAPRHDAPRRDFSPNPGTRPDQPHEPFQPLDRIAPAPRHDLDV